MSAGDSGGGVAHVLLRHLISFSATFFELLALALTFLLSVAAFGAGPFVTGYMFGTSDDGYYFAGFIGSLLFMITTGIGFIFLTGTFKIWSRKGGTESALGFLVILLLLDTRVFFLKDAEAHGVSQAVAIKALVVLLALIACLLLANVSLSRVDRERSRASIGPAGKFIVTVLLLAVMGAGCGVGIKLGEWQRESECLGELKARPGLKCVGVRQAAMLPAPE